LANQFIGFDSEKALPVTAMFAKGLNRSFLSANRQACLTNSCDNGSLSVHLYQVKTR
jgi:hypothetical protein